MCDTESQFYLVTSTKASVPLILQPFCHRAKKARHSFDVLPHLKLYWEFSGELDKAFGR